MEPVKITYFSDILCIWAYASQARLEEVEKTFGDKILIEPRFCSIFGDTKGKITTAWQNRDTYEGFNAHLQEVGKRFPHIEVHPELWLTTRPLSSTSIHLFMKAVEQSLREGSSSPGEYSYELFNQTLSALRIAFFRDCQNISRWDVQCKIAEPLGVNIERIEECIKMGEAFALLAADYQKAEKMQIEGSPSFVLNEGRQKLYGNIGYNLIKANIEELLRDPSSNFASWC